MSDCNKKPPIAPTYVDTNYVETTYVDQLTRKFPMNICAECKKYNCGGQCELVWKSPVYLEKCPKGEWDRNVRI